MTNEEGRRIEELESERYRIKQEIRNDVKMQYDDIRAYASGQMDAESKDYPKEAYSIKSTGEPRQFSTGAVRDTATGKPKMSLLPQDLLARVAKHYELGAIKYGADNWRFGQPQDTTLDSLERHILAYRQGDLAEDHLSAIVWNALSIMNIDEYFKDNPELFNIFGQYPKKP